VAYLTETGVVVDVLLFLCRCQLGFPSSGNFGTGPYVRRSR
jgi:hypothetical protein